VNGRPEVSTSGRLRLASPATAAVLGVLSLVFLFAAIPLEFLVPSAAAPISANVVSNVAWFVFGLSFISVGLVVARRERAQPDGLAPARRGAGSFGRE
jgi:hypothetical protein